MPEDIQQLETEREQLCRQLSEIGDFRRGSINANYRRCGKPSCACAQPGNPGHGPQYLLTVKVEGKSYAKNLHPGQELEAVKSQVDNYHHFRELSDQLVQVNEQICDIRPRVSQAGAKATAKKGALKQASRRKSPGNSKSS